MDRARQALRARRLVVKVGSALLAGPDGGVRGAWLDGLARDIAALRARGQQVAVVTSGAVALGRRRLRLPPQRPLRLEEKQAAAAAGQIVLARAWQESLARVGLETAQVLVTLEDTEARRRYLNARATVDTLLRLGVVPVVNENDTVATSEIRFGDNDRLSARVAVMASAETLVLLSDVDGLYTADPRKEAAEHLPLVEAITPEIEAMAGGAGSAVGTGGMASKLVAARMATASGCAVLLARGEGEAPLAAVEVGARCTLFPARTSPRRARKDWIAASLGVMGTLRIDEGALGALRRGSSLLPAGVTAAEGSFERGDAVLVLAPDGTPVAKGLSAYDAADAQALLGSRTEEIEAILGYRGRDEMIHRDDLVLL
jgi:glutamate 5-kinase